MEEGKVIIDIGMEGIDRVIIERGGKRREMQLRELSAENLKWLLRQNPDPETVSLLRKELIRRTEAAASVREAMSPDGQGEMPL